ncbi:MAG: helix-turn-helix domain-containing protein [Clostridia bacterium]|nr:helix-turn-helix domain-containing protein [Clostridia bacterium]
MNENKPIIAERIKNLRKGKGLTQEQLAEILGLNAKSSIANYESGANSPSDDIKKKMCELFDCSMDYLMGKSEFKNIEREKKNIIDNINNHYKQTLVDLGINIKDVEELLSLNPIALNVYKANSSEELAEPIIAKMTYISNNYSPNVVSHFLSVMKNMLLEEQKIFAEKNYEQLKLHFEESVKAGNVLAQYIEENDLDKFYMCPVYGQISAGQPNWAEENIEGRIPINTNLMDIVNPEEHFFLHVNEEGMNEVVKNGSFALIHKQDSIENGEIAVIITDDSNAILRKVTKQNDLIILMPESEDKSFETKAYDKASIKILGKYVGKMEINK